MLAGNLLGDGAEGLVVLTLELKTISQDFHLEKSTFVVAGDERPRHGQAGIEVDRDD